MGPNTEICPVFTVLDPISTLHLQGYSAFIKIPAFKLNALLLKQLVIDFIWVIFNDYYFNFFQLLIIVFLKLKIFRSFVQQKQNVFFIYFPYYCRRPNVMDVDTYLHKITLCKNETLKIGTSSIVL